ncbi:hypothetical protein HOY80DRAFT_948329 [Tuber brumale]|nr:hypothetical protein HOY80DRAFT_948329 [Tuber brumale]
MPDYLLFLSSLLSLFFLPFSHAYLLIDLFSCFLVECGCQAGTIFLYSYAISFLVL